MANQEKQAYEQFGPDLLISTGDYNQGVGGREAAAIKMTNGSGERCTFKHLESGLTRLESEGNLEITVGEKASEGPTIVINTPNGDVDICVRDGHICLKGTDITLDAKDSIVMKASKIEIGEGNPTSQISIAAQRVECATSAGNLSEVLLSNSALAAFSGSPAFDLLKKSFLGLA
tara:strand:+ start:45 stop:569 length:525 start_codon:yes stop_codon:yes gene_type:complete